MAESVTHAVEQVVADHLAAQWGTTPKAALAQVGAAGGQIDSLAGVELTMLLEHHFGISISDQETFMVCRSVSEISAVVQKKVEKKKGTERAAARTRQTELKGEFGFKTARSS